MTETRNENYAFSKLSDLEIEFRDLEYYLEDKDSIEINKIIIQLILEMKNKNK